MSETIFGDAIPRLVAFLTDEIQTPDDKRCRWAGLKRDHDDFFCDVLGVNPEWGIQAGSLIGFDIDFDRRLVLLNYSPTAHNLLHVIPDGWTPVLRLMRGLVVSYDVPGRAEGVRLVSRGFEKFFNFCELPETRLEALFHWGRKPVSCTRKEDGHMIEYFVHEGQLCATTRGRLKTLSGVASLDMLTRDQFELAGRIVKTAGHDLMTLVCEFVHPMTKVHVDYKGAKRIYLLEAYDYRGCPVNHDVLVDISQAMPDTLRLPERRWMTADQLCAEIADRSVVNCEGWVAQVPSQDGRLTRIKFKYVSYIGEMVKSKLSYKYLMNCLKNDRLDRMLFTLPEEIREHAYSMVDTIVKTAATGSGAAGYRVLYGLHTSNEGGRENFRNTCRDFYRSQIAV